MTEPANLVCLPLPEHPVPPRRHVWNVIPVARMDGSEFPDGNARTLRTCNACGMIKITVHAHEGRSAWREWRTKDGKVWVGQLTPPCLSEPSA